MARAETWVLALVAASLVLYVTVMFAFVGLAIAKRLRTKPPPLAVATPARVSILKPLAGVDEELAENLDSFAALEAPYEILFGVASPLDPAAPIARCFMARHPRVPARLVVTDPNAATNPKVAQLKGLLEEAGGEIVVISDSNVRVRRGYLESLRRELSSEGVGLVTSLIAGSGEKNLGAALENLQLGGVIAPAVGVSQIVMPRPLTVGKSMAMRRHDAVSLAVLDRVSGVLAEDYALGSVFSEAGYDVRTSFLPVDNLNVRVGLSHTIDRHTRWAKMRRAISPSTFYLEPLLSPMAIATLGFFAAPGQATATLCLASGVLQTAGAWTATRVLRGRWMAARYLPLEIVRSFVMLGCWLRACASRRVVWRGHAFKLGKGSVLIPVLARAARRPSDVTS
jgi:ceramide glucosyltransferase